MPLKRWLILCTRYPEDRLPRPRLGNQMRLAWVAASILALRKHVLRASTQACDAHKAMPSRAQVNACEAARRCLSQKLPRLAEQPGAAMDRRRTAFPRVARDTQEESRNEPTSSQSIDSYNQPQHSQGTPDRKVCETLLFQHVRGAAVQGHT